MKKEILIVNLLLLQASDSFAKCQREREELNQWKENCETAATSTVITHTSLISLASPLGWIGAGFAAFASKKIFDNVCRIRDEKQRNLDNCETDAVLEMLDERKKVHEACIEKEQQIFKQKTDDLFLKYTLEGYDPQYIGDLEDFKMQYEEIEKEYEKKVKELKKQYFKQW